MSNALINVGETFNLYLYLSQFEHDDVNRRKKHPISTLYLYFCNIFHITFPQAYTDFY